MRSFRKIAILFVLVVLSTCVYADKWKGEVRPRPTLRETSGCIPAQTSTELAINNVRALIHTGGDMWWDLQGKPRYEVPVGGGVHALYAGAIWIGGKDANGSLKLAAQRFRQDGYDYWPGPLTDDGKAYVSAETCREYDKHFVITKDIVREFRDWWNCSKDPTCNNDEAHPGYVIPDIILNWPSHYDGYTGGNSTLAPWWDVDGDGEYDPINDGDFPYYEFPSEGITNDPQCRRPRGQAARLFGDYTLWWVYNDKGNVHTETGGAAIGMEYRAQAFAFTTNDELNNMTFGNYNIINRSTYTLTETYFGVWTDADLGNPYDDYVGCDVLRGLGYSYNGDDDDETAAGKVGYGTQPPAIGIDFFEGPYQDPDGLDNPTSFDTVNNVKVLNCNRGDILNGNINGLNFEDGVVDNERWGMRRFLYFNNNTGGNPNTQDPHTAMEHYNYLTGKWLDNTQLCYGGTGHYSGGANMDIPTDFMFPGKPTTDVCGWGQGGLPQTDWSEETEGNKPDDRRFVQSAGPFTLRPGDNNDITIGAVYARAPSGGPWASVEAVRRADDKAQVLFENCFRVLDGPDAPELEIIELDKKFIFHIYNKTISNNYLEAYKERDPSIVCSPDIQPCDINYVFQGYQVFQFKDASVSVTDRYNNSLVRQIFQCDIKDGISQIVNYVWSDELRANIPVEEVNGLDEGIVHTFVITQDQFASGDVRLINNKEYYFGAIAYGYNNSMLYDQSLQETFHGQKKPYLAGRNNIKRYKAIPRLVYPGTVTQSEYGDGVEITMLDGQGCGNNYLELTDATIDKIMSGSPWKADVRTYKKGRGPIKVKIIDPLNVVADDYRLYFDSTDVALNSYGYMGCKGGYMNPATYTPFNYYLVNSHNDTIFSDVPVGLNFADEQLFMDYGFSISIAQENFPGEDKNPYQNGFVGASMTYADDSKPWLMFVPDADGPVLQNWIRLGTYVNKAIECIDKSYDDFSVDKKQYFEKILGGLFAPYKFANSSRPEAVAYKGAQSSQDIRKGEPIPSVDLVITSDTSKWTRSCVVEMHPNQWSKDEQCPNMLNEDSKWTNPWSEGHTPKFSMRVDSSVDKQGRVDGSGTIGYSWFPGYAIDVVTGERLNIVFGEDSWEIGQNGCDMMWNPCSKWLASSYSTTGAHGCSFFGGHYIYIMGNNRNSQEPKNAPAYDSCKFFHDLCMEFYNDFNATPRRLNKTALQNAWASAAWVAIPAQNPDFDFLATDITIQLRATMPYFRNVKEFEQEDSENGNFPAFSFSTKNLETINHDTAAAVSALDLIRVVPNPYYGTSSYEHNQLDNYVRITNLPNKCVVSIYNAAGGLIRRFDKDNSDSFVEWDLKNTYNITIASGVYIIHINAPGVGEKIVKWFGVLRPVDLNNF